MRRGDWGGRGDEGGACVAGRRQGPPGAVCQLCGIRAEALQAAPRRLHLHLTARHTLAPGHPHHALAFTLQTAHVMTPAACQPPATITTNLWFFRGFALCCKFRERERAA